MLPNHSFKPTPLLGAALFRHSADPSSESMSMVTHLAETLTSTLTMRQLDVRLRQDIRRSLLDAIAAGSVFPCRAAPLNIFRRAVSSAMGQHSNRLAKLVEDNGFIDPECPQSARAVAHYMAIRFALYRAVAAIQGSLAEMLALGPMMQLMTELKAAWTIPRTTRMWVGDTVVAPSHSGSALSSAADIHLLSAASDREPLTLIGVAEVKSYRCSWSKAVSQLDRHLARANQGLATRALGGQETRRRVVLADAPLRVFVFPARWRLSRHFGFSSNGGRRFLHIDPPKPAATVTAVSDQPREWRIVLRWSGEALAAAAFELVLWYLGRLGERVYLDRPSPWPEMSPAEAGQNAAKSGLYYAILNIDDPETRDQAIKLYNVLGFGFALGSAFRGRDGRPAMLWPQDLDEILENGRTRDGGYILRTRTAQKPAQANGATRRR